MKLFSFGTKKNTGEAKTETLKIQGMHCVSCSMNIDGELEESNGVLHAETSFAKGETKIQFDPTKTNLEEIQKTIKKLGYSASL